MPNDDFSIKTGIEVDDSGIQKLKDFSESLANIAEALDRVKSSKFDTGLSSGLKNIKSEAAKAKKEINGIADALNKQAKKSINNGKSLGAEQTAKTAFNAIDPDTYSRIYESLNNAASAAERIKEALGGDIQSGLLTQINQMLDKKDELMNLANVLKANKEAIDSAAKATGGKGASKRTSVDVGNKKDVKLTADQISDYTSTIQKRIKDTYSDFNKYSVSVGSNGKVSISKQFKDEVGNLQTVAYNFDDVTDLIGTKAEDFKKNLEEGFSSGRSSISGKNSISKEISDLYKKKTETESEYQRLRSPFVENTKEENERLLALEKERNEINKKLNSQMPEIKNASADSEIGKARSEYLKKQKEVEDNFSGTTVKDVYGKLGVASAKNFEGSADVFSNLTSKVNDLTDAFNNGKISSEQYSEQTQKLFNGFDKTIAKLDPGNIDELKKKAQDYLELQEIDGWKRKGEFSVTDKENSSVITATFENDEGMLKSIQVQANAANGVVTKLSESLKQVKQTASTSKGIEKVTTDKSYVGDLKMLSKTASEAELRKLVDGKTFSYDKDDRIKAEDRISKTTPRTDAEIKALSDYEEVQKRVAENSTKYSSQIQKAYSDFNNLRNAKTGIQGLEQTFNSAEESMNKWTTSLLNGSMNIETFQKKMSSLQSSIGSIYKVTDVSNGVDANSELQNFIKELSGVENIDFSGISIKGDIAKLSGTFKNAAGEAQTLNAQINLTNGEMRLLSSSTSTVDSGFSKFFSGWKEKMVNLAQYLTSFQAINQVWNTFKQGIEVVKKFDTALTEMRKVSDEPVSKLKEFQKESFDMAKGVGTTALQIQNSTADFMRLGQSMESAKQSASNANILKNVSEFDNIEDATSALISMKAAYSDLSQERIIDSLNAVGEKIRLNIWKHMGTLFLVSSYNG